MSNNRMEAATASEADMSLAVEIKGLSKTYSGAKDKRPALDAVDLEVPRGSRFALLGPNGAGKSTLINILAGLVVKSSGSARIWGFDTDREMRAARRAIGVVPQELNIDPFFTPRELLELQAGLYGVPPAERRTEELLEVVDLADKAEAYARSLSGGMRRRLMVAKAMVHAPPVLVLDEPTAGVDVELRQQLWAQVRRMNDAGTTVMLTTHYLEEAEELCDWIAIINHGRVVACDRMETLLKRLDYKELAVSFGTELTEIPSALRSFDARLEPPGRVVVRFRKSMTPIRDILAAVQATGLEIYDMSTSEPDLEDTFIAITQGHSDWGGEPGRAKDEAAAGIGRR